MALAEYDPLLRDAYDHAALSLLDGKPLLWMARALGHPLPEKISGSDLVVPLLEQATQEDLSVFLFGAAPGVADTAAQRLQEKIPGLDVCCAFSPPLGFERDPACTEEALARLLEHNPAFVLVALGCPKQEVFMHTHAGRLTPAVCLGIGASLDFIAATVRRAPRWMSEAGLEWTYRLFQDPARMYQRYLIRDRAIVPIFVRMLRMPHAERAFFVER